MHSWDAEILSAVSGRFECKKQKPLWMFQAEENLTQRIRYLKSPKGMEK